MWFQFGELQAEPNRVTIANNSARVPRMASKLIELRLDPIGKGSRPSVSIRANVRVPLRTLERSRTTPAAVACLTETPRKVGPQNSRRVLQSRLCSANIICLSNACRLSPSGREGVDLECPRFDGHLSAGSSGPAGRMSRDGKEWKGTRAIPA